MIITHGFWSMTTSRLCLWAEDSSADNARGASPDAHPLAVNADTAGLAAGLNGALGAATVWLPSTASGPLSASTVGALASGEEVSLRPWRVPIKALSAAEALNLLIDRPLPPSSGALRALREVAQLALCVVARGRVTPELKTEGSQHLATWQPRLDPALRAWMEALVDAMPAACRCGHDVDVEQPAQPSARALVHHLMAVWTDLIVRHTLRDVDPCPGAGSHIAKRWVEALATRQPIVPGSPAELARLDQALRSWSELPDTNTSDYSLTLRLQAPEDGVAPWALTYLLSARSDPSLYLDAAALWDGHLGAIEAEQGQIEALQERLLVLLGRASRSYAPIARSLERARPGQARLSTEEAFSFLKTDAKVLSASGFRIQLPALLTEERPMLGARLIGRQAPGGKSGGLDALKFDWQLALGDESLTADELEVLSTLKVPLVKLRGQWIEVSPEELERTLAFMRAQSSGAPTTMSATDVLRLASGLEQSPIGLPVLGIEAVGELGDLLNGKSTRIRFKTTPAGFEGTLRKYQRRGLSWLDFLGKLGMGACLADDMGLGKTVQLLGLLAAERFGTPSAPKQLEVPPTLLIGPTSLLGNWRREAAKFVPDLRVYVHHGPERLTGAEFLKKRDEVDLILTTYGVMARDAEAMRAQRWFRVVLDEAQHIKNSHTKQARAVHDLDARHRVALTGTPIENRLMELWSIMRFLNPGLLGTEGAFRRKIANPIERYQDAEKADVLRQLCVPFVLRRLKSDKTIIKDLPDKMEFKEYCNLTIEQTSLYQAVLDEVLEAIDGASGVQRRGLVLSAMTRLKQICDHPALFLKDKSALKGRAGKLTRLEELLDTILAGGERALIFTQFTTMGDALEPYLRRRFGVPVLWLKGSTSRKKRDQMVEAFQAEGGPPIFLISLKAGGTGLTLTRANHVIHYDRWWNPAVENQATDRAFRIGQTKNVQVRKMISAGTLEERIDAMIEDKRALADNIIHTGEAALTELSTAELRAVLTLSSEAIADRTSEDDDVDDDDDEVAR